MMITDYEISKPDLFVRRLLFLFMNEGNCTANNYQTAVFTRGLHELRVLELDCNTELKPVTMPETLKLWTRFYRIPSLPFFHLCYYFPLRPRTSIPPVLRTPVIARSCCKSGEYCRSPTRPSQREPSQTKTLLVRLPQAQRWPKPWRV